MVICKNVGLVEIMNHVDRIKKSRFLAKLDTDINAVEYYELRVTKTQYNESVRGNVYDELK